MAIHSFFRLTLAAALAAAIAGCESWTDIGPEPDNFIGRGKSETLLTDPALHAVIPHVAGDEPGGASPSPAPPIPPPPPHPPPPPAPPPPLSNPSPFRTPSSPASNTTSIFASNASTSPSPAPASRAALANFDPTVILHSRAAAPSPAASPLTPSPRTASVTEFLPTGTTIQPASPPPTNFYSESALSQSGNLTVTQALLRGAASTSTSPPSARPSSPPGSPNTSSAARRIPRRLHRIRLLGPRLCRTPGRPSCKLARSRPEAAR